MSGTKWGDFEIEELERFAAVLKAKYPPPQINDPNQLASESGRIALALRAGAASVASDIAAEIRNITRKG